MVMNSAENVSVKPLEFVEIKENQWQANTPFGAFSVVKQPCFGKAWRTFSPTGWATYIDDDPEELKRITEHAYCKRILSCLRSPPTEDGDRVIAWLGTNLDGESEPFLSERQAEFWSNGASKVEPLYLRAKQPFSERDATNLLSVIADIRAKSGLGVKPMLSELADAIAARIASPTPETVGVSEGNPRLEEMVRIVIDLMREATDVDTDDWQEMLTAALSPQEGE